jgi:DNA-directed RNA polymerase specialized sigma24 family protein
MPTQWFRGLDATTRERYPALLSYAVMLTPDRDEARELTDAAIASVMGAFRPPRVPSERERALRTAIAAGYLARHRTDATPTSNATGATTPDSTFRPPAPSSQTTTVADADRRGRAVVAEPGAPGDQDASLGVAADSPLAMALAHLSPAERVAAISWWIDGLGAEEVAERMETTLNAATDALHHAGVMLASATGAAAPARDHYLGSGDVVTVEVSGEGGRR